MQSTQNISKFHTHIPPISHGIKNFDVKKHEALDRIGIHIPAKMVDKMYKATMDAAIQPVLTTPNIGVPVQFLQTWLPGNVWILSAPRKIDELIGVDIIGAWFDEQIVQTILEPTGSALPYTDYQNVPLSSYNINYAYNTVVRFEEGMFVANMESERASRVNVSADATKRQAATLALEISRNLVGFFGYNNGANQTYGFFNAPGLPSYVTVPNGASSSPLWSTKTLLEITKDIRTAANALTTQSQGIIDPLKDETTLALGTNVLNYLTVISDFGYSVFKWIADNYPRMRVVAAPQLNTANGGVGVFYLYADKIEYGMDFSTDGGRVFAQNVQTKFLVNGVEKQAKGYLEDYLNATAGVMLKRPFGVVRYSGIS
jgi:hypothetical protein